MRVRLTHIDGKLPNLALMKLSAWHKSRGDEVTFSRKVRRDMLEPAYDRVYGSAIFSMSGRLVEALRAEFPDVVLGGTGTPERRTVEEELGDEDLERYDYSLYPDFDASIGFTQRGCRLKCKFCVVPWKEGKPRSVNTISDIWRGPEHPRHIHLLDNDFFGQPPEEWRARIREIREGGFRVCLNQGINVRLINEEAAAALASIQYYDDQFSTRRLYTAWDNLKDEKIFFRGVDMLERAGVPPTHLLVYMLVGFDPSETWERVLYRFERMRERGIRPYPMIYGEKDRALLPGGVNWPVERRSLRHFQRWANRPAKLGIPFSEYDANAKGWADKRQGALW
jgi:hypothetical protein